MDTMAQVAGERIRVGSLLGLFAKAFKLFVQEVCVQDQKSSTGFVVAIVAAMNTYSRNLESDMRILCQWQAGQVYSVKLELRFAHPQSKYRRVTSAQSESGLLEGRSKRAMYWP